MERLKYIDTVKGIGIFLVVIGHNVIDIPLIDHWIYSFHMPLFFIISGFMFAHKGEKHVPLKKLISKKMKTLLYPYFTFSMIVVIWHFVFFHILFPSSSPEIETLEALLLSVSTLGYHALWFVPCLFWSIVLFSVILRNKYYHVIISLITIFCLVCNSFWRFNLVAIAPNIYKYIFRVIMGMSFVYFGYVFYNVLQKIKRCYEYIMIGSCFVISVVLFVLFLLFPKNFPICNLSTTVIGNPFVYHITALSNSIWIILFCKNIKFPSKLIDFFGKNSFVIMALHMDVTIHVSWIIFELFNISFDLTINSIIVNIIQFLLLSIIVVVINKYFPFILKYPFKVRCLNKVKN